MYFLIKVFRISLQNYCKIVITLLSFIDHAYYDVAIIEMDITVEFNNFVYPICIPEKEREIDNRVNVGASLAGWGATEDFDGKPSTVLKETKMNVFSQLHCNNSWDIPELFQSNLMCAGSVSSTFFTSKSIIHDDSI